jgi:mono/diheme cytochrome c family protein
MCKTLRVKLEVIVWLGLASLAVVVPLAAMRFQEPASRPAAGATREERIARGARAYRVYCAGCHGAGAKGDGPLADLLKVPPSDLTHFSAGSGGTFPVERVTEAIDGRAVVRGHGSQMPAWAMSFRDRGSDWDQRQEVEERIRDLVQFLESIQAKVPDPAP